MSNYAVESDIKLGFFFYHFLDYMILNNDFTLSLASMIFSYQMLSFY